MGQAAKEEQRGLCGSPVGWAGGGGGEGGRATVGGTSCPTAQGLPGQCSPREVANDFW